MARLRVGLTGGLASGKSTVARRLAARPGFLVIDADRLVADLYRPGEEGPRPWRPSSAPAAARTAPSTGDARRRRVRRRAGPPPLEQAIHPLVRERFAALPRP